MNQNSKQSKFLPPTETKKEGKPKKKKQIALNLLPSGEIKEVPNEGSKYNSIFSLEEETMVDDTKNV